MDNELILAIDFDGTVTTEPDIGCELVLQPDAKRVLERFKEDGVRLVLWTCRTGNHLNEALEFLESNELLSVFDTVNEQLPEVLTKYYPDVAPKVGADVYFDDKNAMTDVDWNKFEEFIYGGM